MPAATRHDYPVRTAGHSSMIEIYAQLLGHTLIPPEEVAALVHRAPAQLIAETLAGSEAFAADGLPLAWHQASQHQPEDPA